MAWIELHDTLPDHDKVISVADSLNIDKDLVVGKLVRLWVWALNNREDGTFKARDVHTIAEVMRYKGKPQRLVDALVEARLLDLKDDIYIIHDWDERVGMLLAKRETVRAQTRARVQRSRNKKTGNGEVTSDVTQCNALQERYVTDDVTQCNAVTVPKPYHIEDDDEDVEDTLSTRACVREADGPEDEMWGIERTICDAFRGYIGRYPMPAEITGIGRAAVLKDKAALIPEAIKRAGMCGAKSIVNYVVKLFCEWELYCIETADELSKVDYLLDCLAGKAGTFALEPQEAHRQLEEFREQKAKSRRREGA